ncbi:MAG: c-type cytochrome biogenesis protein CcmI [Pseudomonadota bacterium]
MLFWILAALMLAASLLIVLPALLGERAPQTIERNKLNAAIYKDQLAELEADLRNETLSPAQFEQARHDLERSLLAEVTDAAPKKPVVTTAVARNTAIAVGLAVPVLAIGVYLQLGKSDAALSNQTAQATMAAMNGLTPEMMAERLAERLKTNPQDGMGWAMLGRSYSVLGRFADATDAYAKALPLLGDDPQLLADYAEVLALSSSDQRLAGKPTEYFEKALKLDPQNQKALWLAGMAAFQQQDFKNAGVYWKRLAALMPQDSEDAQVINQRIADAEARAAGGLTR